MIRPHVVALIADLALVGELDGVADEVEQHLREAALVAMADGQIWGHVDRQGELLSGCERLDRSKDGLDHVLERVVRKIERQLTGLDFGQVEHVIDQAEEMLAVGLQAVEHLAHLVRRLSVDVIENKLGVAQDGVERRPQLVAHVGEELRLVLAGDFELTALLVDLGEQMRVLDRQHRLGGESLEQIDVFSGNVPGAFRRTTSAPITRSRANSGTTSNARNPARATMSWAGVGGWVARSSICTGSRRVTARSKIGSPSPIC